MFVCWFAVFVWCVVVIVFFVCFLYRNITGLANQIVGLCKTCAYSCHYGHNVCEVNVHHTMRRKFRCDCGNHAISHTHCVNTGLPKLQGTLINNNNNKNTKCKLRKQYLPKLNVIKDCLYKTETRRFNLNNKYYNCKFRVAVCCLLFIVFFCLILFAKYVGCADLP